jgi:hypothetical protein
MLGKKGFVITPVIFIAFMLIAITFSFYISDIDSDISQGIQKAAAVEKAVTDIYKYQINQVNYAKLAAYKCSDLTCYSLGNESTVEDCVESSLNNTFSNTSWNVDISNDTEIYHIGFDISSFNATNINMTSDRSYVRSELHKAFFKTC